MNNRELKLILSEGETSKIEFKENIKNIDKEIVAFANSSGGRIFLGVGDDNTIKGIKVTNELKSRIQDTANNCKPKIDINLSVVDGTDNVLIVDVSEGRNKPYMCKEGFFARIGPNSQKLSRDEILKIAIKEGRVRYDEEINTKFDFNNDFDEKGFLNFLEESGITANLPYENILVNMNLAEKKNGSYYFKNAVPLFFSKNIRKFNTSAYTTCILFKGNTRSYIIDRKDFDGNLAEQVEDALNFVKKNTLLAYQIKDIVRKEIPQYPVDAVREGIVNAVMHRDYFETGSNVFVYIYDDFIEIVNPGGLFGISRDQLGKICMRRNERIADLFKIRGLVEKAGTGIQRMKDAMRKDGLKELEIDVSENFFIATFYGHKRKELGKISEGRGVIELNERQEMALEYLSNHDYITTNILSKIAGVSERQARYDLKDLSKKDILSIKGTTKARQYFLKIRQNSANSERML